MGERNRTGLDPAHGFTGLLLTGNPRGGKSSAFEMITVALRVCGGGRCRVEGAVVALCERHHAALVTGGAR